MAQSEGTILHLQRLSTEDGPGIRTTVFFKGCPLRCDWCHNPESISLQPQVQWLENRCIAWASGAACHTCIKACPHGALTWADQGASRDRAICQACGSCAEVCPSNAHEMLGRRISVDHLVKELRKDRAFFTKSGGGVTLSGGEPALQPAFALALLRALRDEGIPTALDTCGLAQTGTLLELAAESDLTLYDVKLLDARAHRHYTGVENHQILGNLSALGETMAEYPQKRLWIRTPLIPGATDSAENITAIGRWLAEHLAGLVERGVLERWEICAFNNLCRDKYRRLGLDWKYSSTPLLTRERLDQAGDWARQSGFPADRIFVTGAARLDN